MATPEAHKRRRTVSPGYTREVLEILATLGDANGSTMAQITRNLRRSCSPKPRYLKYRIRSSLNKLRDQGVVRRQGHHYILLRPVPKTGSPRSPGTARREAPCSMCLSTVACPKCGGWRVVATGLATARRCRKRTVRFRLPRQPKHPAEAHHRCAWPTVAERGRSSPSVAELNRSRRTLS
ncbi:uncharacterized protein LOC134536505 [Bacillus rossius redtenbacheri]|uniref:uncharacterized protein LOC134536505 n=1 Tax=Bacillus rossius redtenbacheri TaxID=93214 RepID=UPI002FDDE3AD